MSKSLGNSFLPGELFSGNHPLLERGYSPMTVRFFMLQSHYSSTLDFSNEALGAAERGFKKLTATQRIIKAMEHPGGEKPEKEINQILSNLVDDCYKNMSDDFNTAKTLAVLFDMSARINDLYSGNTSITKVEAPVFNSFKQAYIGFMEDVLGLREETTADNHLLEGALQVLIDLRKKVRADKNFQLSDKIRDDLKDIGVQLKDGKDGEMGYAIE